MEATQLPQSNVAALPPPVAGPATLLPSAPQLSPFPLLPAAPRISRSLKRRPASDGRYLPAAHGSWLAKALRARWDAYRSQLQKCQEEFSEEAVHQLRVATRRLIAQLVLLDYVIPGLPLEKARRILKRRLTALSELRDTHVQRIFLEHKAADFPELLLVCDWLKRRERRFEKVAEHEVGCTKVKKIERWIGAITNELARAPGGVRVEQLGSTVLSATSKAFTEVLARRRAIRLADRRSIHQTRVAFKKFRYMVESLSPALTGLSKRHLRALAVYQRKMGIIQDLEVMQSCLATFSRETPAADVWLDPFCRYLRLRQARALRSFLKSANQIFDFWPPARLIAIKQPVTSERAA